MPAEQVKKVAFSTANRITRGGADTQSVERLNEDRMDAFFIAAVEAVEEAILNALWHGVPHRGYDGSLLPAFRVSVTGESICIRSEFCPAYFSKWCATFTYAVVWSSFALSCSRR